MTAAAAVTAAVAEEDDEDCWRHFNFCCCSYSWRADSRPWCVFHAPSVVPTSDDKKTFVISLLSLTIRMSPSTSPAALWASGRSSKKRAR